MRLENKIALITGGYGGMGRASARLFAEEGATVFIAGRNEERGDALVKEINEAGGKAHFVELDVVNQSQWDAAVAQVKEQASGLHILMNIVGSNALERFPKIDIDEWNKIFEINVTGTLRGIQTCAPLIKESGGGSIVNIGSVAGITGNFATGYSSSKWALEGLSRSLTSMSTPTGASVVASSQAGSDRSHRIHEFKPAGEKDAGQRDEQHRTVAPEWQSGGYRLYGLIPRQRGILLHHWHRYCGRRRMVFLSTLPRQ